jgi:hypothetical protein
MLSAKETFDQFSVLWETYFKDIETINSIIGEYEEKTNIQLTAGAKQILFIPVIEHLNIGELIDENQIFRTLGEIFSSMETDPDIRDIKLEDEIRSGFSVIKAFWDKFCKIPPFCK